MHIPDASSSDILTKIIMISLGLCLWADMSLAETAPASAGEKTFWERDQLLGDADGIRPKLDNYGVTLGLNETSELLGNTSGGIKRGFDYDGLSTLILQMDTSKRLGIDGGLLNVSAMDIHGSNLSAHNLDTLQTASGIAGNNTFRLWELWYQQSFMQNQLDVRVGQQSIDSEFMISQNALLFVNTSMGWPMIPSNDLLFGGPAYPLSAPGVRVHVKPNDTWAFLAGVYNDDPSGVGPRSGLDSQRLDDHGTNFRLSDNALAIAEVQFTHPIEMVGKSLPGTYRLGGWVDFGYSADQRYGTDNISLATGNGIAKLHHGNYSIYGVADQMIWREKPDDKQTVNFFFRGMWAPQQQNLVDYNLNTGFTLHAPFEGRDDDTIGLGYGYTNISDVARALDVDSGVAIRRSGEHFVELTYQYAVAPWWQVQPDFQYVINPGAGVIDSNNPTSTKRLGDEAVIGVRTNITF